MARGKRLRADQRLPTLQFAASTYASPRLRLPPPPPLAASASASASASAGLHLHQFTYAGPPSPLIFLFPPISGMGDKRLKLTTEQEKLFLETCIEETVRVGYMGVSLQRESWAIVGKKLLEAYGMVVEQKQLKNKYDYLRAKYLAWSYLKRKTGNIYNPHTNMFTLTNEDWDAVCKVHPKAASLKTTPLANHELCATTTTKMAF
ncbi:hypothetical protein QVD17_16191 [Tagetes erecta]|uniref:Myb/SANT-like domain-containing protein n=1 Tax=Tagetes erecta TaxID=13708 RepID=A0AAD8KQH6_TARER|nr:hypothetical protein QVD17_16191 [Tagetes erecta]